MPDNKFKKYFFYVVAGIVGWLVAISGIFTGIAIDQETIQHFLGEAASNEITKAGFFFTLAAWLHAGRVKKEIKESFKVLSASMDSLGAALRADLKNHSERLDNLSSRVQHIENNPQFNPRS